MPTLQETCSRIRIRGRAVWLALSGNFDSSTRIVSRKSRSATIAGTTSQKPVNGFEKELGAVLKHFGIKQREFQGLPDRLKDVLKACRSSVKNRKQAMRRANSMLMLFRLWQWMDGRCYLCDQKKKFNQITADHVFPKSHGYSLSRNSMPCCSACNGQKQDRLPTVAEIQYACEAYEGIGKVFDPSSAISISEDNPWEVFKPIGLAQFDPRGETK